MDLLKKANDYIRDNRHKADMRYRPRFHAVAPVGWINDPNGFYFDGEWYHLFYQYYPYDAKWNDMHWGHWRSRDLVRWEDMPVAMAPDKPYDAFGCFSGTALPDGRGGAVILYTGVSQEGSLQQQCLARFDGTRMVKDDGNPVMPFAMLPEGFRTKDFRDPALFTVPGGYRAVMAAKRGDRGMLICCSSKDLEHWRFEGEFAPTDGAMPECPDLLDIDGRTVVLYSKTRHEEVSGERTRPVVYAVGDLSADGCAFSGTPWRRLDYGREFYAAQTCMGDAGAVAVSWLSNWDMAYPTYPLGHGWSGMMSLPRMLRLEGDRLVQSPPPMIGRYRGEKRCLSARLTDGGRRLEGLNARHAELCLTADVSGAEELTISVMEDGDERVALRWAVDTLTLDRSAAAYNGLGRLVPQLRMPLEAVDGRIEMTVYVDGCAIEVFAGGDTMSALAFPRGDGGGVSVSARGTARVELTVHKLCEAQEGERIDG